MNVLPPVKVSLQLQFRFADKQLSNSENKYKNKAIAGQDVIDNPTARLVI